MSTEDRSKRQAAYMIPVEQIDWIRIEAARRKVWPAHILEEAIDQYRQSQAAGRASGFNGNPHAAKSA